MSCSNCSSGGGSPKGCKNHGTCSSGGCNKLEVYDWLANLAVPAGIDPYPIVEVRFKNSRKGFYRNTHKLALQVGDVLVVEGTTGWDVGVVSVTGELAKIQVEKKLGLDFQENELKKITRIAKQEDIDKWIHARSLEKEVMYQSRTLAVNLNLEMKISDVEYQADLTKAIFYYTAEGRVDFRQLIKDMAEKFKIRIEMRQIGSRQEASRLGGIGSCGRELCCSTWLTDFRSVSTSAARYQQLSLNPQKLAGQCGKLKCCLNYELDTYLDGLKGFPKTEIKLKTKTGSAFHIKTDVFKREMTYMYESENSHNTFVSLTPERVKEIIQMNKEGQFPQDLKSYTIEVPVVKEVGYDNVVGQDSLNRFEHAFKSKNKKKKKKPGNPNQGNPNQGNPNQVQANNRPAEPRNLAIPNNDSNQERKPKKRFKPRPKNNNNNTNTNNNG